MLFWTSQTQRAEIIKNEKNNKKQWQFRLSRRNIFRDTQKLLKKLERHCNHDDTCNEQQHALLTSVKEGLQVSDYEHISFILIVHGVIATICSYKQACLKYTCQDYTIFVHLVKTVSFSYILKVYSINP